jgi:hypothetical protein
MDKDTALSRIIANCNAALATGNMEHIREVKAVAQTLSREKAKPAVVPVLPPHLQSMAKQLTHQPSIKHDDILKPAHSH